MGALPLPQGNKNRLVYDMKNQGSTFLPGKLVRIARRGRPQARLHPAEYYPQIAVENPRDSPSRDSHESTVGGRAVGAPEAGTVRFQRSSALSGRS